MKEKEKKDNEQNLFNEGIQILGNKLGSVRLGGIYILYEMAQKTQRSHKKHT